MHTKNTGYIMDREKKQRNWLKFIVTFYDGTEDIFLLYHLLIIDDDEEEIKHNLMKENMERNLSPIIEKHEKNKEYHKRSYIC